MTSGDWADGPLVGFDLETTGLDRERDEPVSYAFVEFDGGAKVRTEAGYVLPECALSPGAIGVHGLTRDRLVALEAVPRAEGVRRIAQRLATLSAEGVPIVGCNLSYDLTILDRVMARDGAFPSLRVAGWRGPALDVLVIDRGLDDDFEQRPVRKLDALCEHYATSPPDHSAVGDATAAVRVLLAQARRFEVLGRQTIEGLQEQQARWFSTWYGEFAARHRPDGQLAFFELEEAWPYVERVCVQHRRFEATAPVTSATVRA